MQGTRLIEKVRACEIVSNQLPFALEREFVFQFDRLSARSN